MALSRYLNGVGDDAYKLKLSRDMNVSATFNVDDVASYVEKNFKDLRESPSQEGMLMHTKPQTNFWIVPHPHQHPNLSPLVKNTTISPLPPQSDWLFAHKTKSIWGVHAFLGSLSNLV